MKSSFLFRGVSVAVMAGLLAATPGALPAQSTPAVVSAQPGQRGGVTVPAPDADGLHLTLDQAIRLALANNQDLNVSVNAAEASQFFLFQNTGIYDPLLTNNVTRSHTDTPQSSNLGGAEVLQNDSWSADIGLQQLTPWGGIVNFGLNGSYNTTNSTFVDVNPAEPANLFFAVSPAAAAQLRPAAHRDQHRDLAQHARRLVPDVHPQRPGRHQLGRAVLLGPRLRQREPHREARGPRHRAGAQPHHENPDRRGLARPDRHRPDRGRHRDGGAGHHHRRGSRRARRGPPAPGPQLPGREPHDGPHHPDRRRSTCERQQFDLADGVRSALTRRPEIIAQNYTVESNTLRYEYWKNQTLPQLDLVAGYGKNGLGGTFIDPQTGQVIARSATGGTRRTSSSARTSRTGGWASSSPTRS